MMDDDYFLEPIRITTAECKKHVQQKQYFKLGHRYFCPDCVADYLEKAVGQVKVTMTYE